VNELELIVEHWARLWSQPDGDEADFERLFSADCIYQDVPFGESCRGRAETRDFHARSRLAFPDFALTVESTIVGDGAVCATWRMTGTHQGELPGLPATGRSVSMPGVSVLRITAGQIAHCTDYYDAATMLKQLTGDGPEGRDSRGPGRREPRG
jgi:steroid delta-isomerase-like uncharacterized protein